MKLKTILILLLTIGCSSGPSDVMLYDAVIIEVIPAPRINNRGVMYILQPVDMPKFRDKTDKWSENRGWVKGDTITWYMETKQWQALQKHHASNSAHTLISK